MNLIVLILFLPLILGAVMYLYLNVSPRFKMIKSPVFSLVAWLVYLHRRWLIWSVCGGYLIMIVGVIIVMLMKATEVIIPVSYFFLK